ncbi:MAG TPA: alpha/beta fold hydrolase [Polyangiaceae bacterium]|nr:alpha/beta fold hydrolase [Polyangiaceae bacterium]
MTRIAPTPRDVVLCDGAARLLRFRGPTQAGHAPVLLVPSLINRWYVLDLCPGVSVVEALTAAGLDVYLLDWGVPGDEDRHLEWDEIVARLHRMVRRVGPRIGLLGYCLGGTLAAIEAALEPERIVALVNLAGPIDFSEGGRLTLMTDPRWFDAEAIAEAGNVSAAQLQSGFVALRPTRELAKLVMWLDKLGDQAALERADALERWARDNVAFPAAAYARYVRALYQENELVRGEHRIFGSRVDLHAIEAPVLTVVASEDAICPPRAASALHAFVRASRLLQIPGGHVGAVVGSRAARELYPTLVSWLSEHSSITPPSPP